MLDHVAVTLLLSFTPEQTPQATNHPSILDVHYAEKQHV